MKMITYILGIISGGLLLFSAFLLLQLRRIVLALSQVLITAGEVMATVQENQVCGVCRLPYPTMLHQVYPVTRWLCPKCAAEDEINEMLGRNVDVDHPQFGHG